MKFLLCWILLLFMSSFIHACPYATLSSSHVFDTNQSDPLDVMNTYLQQAYIQNQNDLLQHLVTSHQLSIIVVNGHMALYRNGTLTTPSHTSPPLYPLATNLKLISHIALSLIVMMEPSRHGDMQNGIYPLTPTNREQLTWLHQHMPTILPTLSSRGLTSQQYQHSKHICDTCMNVLEQVLHDDGIDVEMMQKWREEIRDDLMSHLNDASISILDIIHHTMMAWKRDVLTSTEWDTLRVIVLGGSHMARHNEMRMQYFTRLLQSPINSGLRVMYAESNEIENQGFPLLATHIIDFAIGEYVFGDAEFMHSDVMATSTSHYLDTLLADYPLPHDDAHEDHIKLNMALGIGIALLVVGIILGALLIHCYHRYSRPFHTIHSPSAVTDYHRVQT